MSEGCIGGEHKLWAAEMAFKPFMKLSFGAFVFLDSSSSAFGGGVEDNLNTHLLHSYLFWIAIFVIW